MAQGASLPGPTGVREMRESGPKSMMRRRRLTAAVVAIAGALAVGGAMPESAPATPLDGNAM
jgi:hypothetical protein